MSEWLGQTNQHLYQARLLIDATNDQSVRAMVNALEDGAVFQLMLAYRSYLNELAYLAQVKDEFMSLADLISKTSVPIGEMRELDQLENDPYSWLSSLLSRFEDCGQPGKASHTNQAGMIQLVQQTPATDLQTLYQALSDLIDLQRNNRQES